MEEKKIKVRFMNQDNEKVFETSLPETTRFQDLTKILCEEGCMPSQKPGYYYIIKNHLCGGLQCLADYLPKGKDSLDVLVFGEPQIMV